MKRDMDLARKMLLAIENSLDDRNIQLKFGDYTPEVVSYHISLLLEAGLIRATGIGGDDRMTWHIGGLTWEGHEFLDAARDNGRWEKAKGMMSQAGAFGFEIIKQVLVELAKSQLHLPPG